MESLWPQLEPVLAEVQKPARYIGCEEGAQQPIHSPEQVAWLLIYPDTYEIGLPNQGLQILYEILNERPDSLAERTYAPWVDMEAQLRAHGLPLFSLENHLPASAFDLLAFNLSAELVYTNLLNCVDLAGVPVRTADRTEAHPLVVAGGHCTYNPEPLADFVDIFVLGDGEEVVSEVSEVVGCWKRSGRPVGSREQLLRELSAVPGVYVPSMYKVTYDGVRIDAVTPRYPDVPAQVEKRTIADLAEWPYPKQQLVPLTEVVHDRLNVEVFRGCTRGCRFCQAGMITRPVRERPAEQVRTMVEEGLRRTGYDEVALTSLSSADFSGIHDVVAGIVNDPANCGQVTVSLPSLRVDAFTVGIAAEIQKVRRSGLTFAPEAGTWRMRQVINKLIREEDLYGAVESAFSQGWRRVKLYFLIGLPTETDEDTLGIARLARNCVEVGRRHQKGASVTVSVGGFVPKPFTPFQWFGQNTVVELQRKVNLLRDELRGAKGVQLKWHDPKATMVEGIMSRGDRRIGAVIEHAWRAGGTFQEWSEFFSHDLWLDAMASQGLSVDDWVYRHRTEHEVLPWDHLSAGLHRDFLWQDWRDALDELGLEDCRWIPCYDCGACTGYGIEHVVASAVPPAGGSQGTGQDLSVGHELPVVLRTKPPRDPQARSTPVEVGRVRVRLRFTKLGKIRFTSHRDVARIWERSLRKAGLPLAYSEGFSPRPRLHFGLALSTGHESLAEYLDLDLRPPTEDPEHPEQRTDYPDAPALADLVVGLPDLLSPLLPDGLDVTAAAVVPSTGAESLQQSVTSSSWEISVRGISSEVVADSLQRLLDAETLPVTRERKGKPVNDDIRRYLLDLTSKGTLTRSIDDLVLVRAELGTQPRAVRPAELLRAMHPDAREGRVLRTHQWIAHDGHRTEPLTAAPGARPAGRRRRSHQRHTCFRRV